MSLRFRLNLLITLLFALILFAGSFYVINNARTAVKDEMHSVARLTLQLIEIALSNNPEIPDTAHQESEARQGVLEKIAQLESTRHLEIHLIERGKAEDSVPVTISPVIAADAPSWFIRLVKPSSIEFRRIFQASDDVTRIEILIRANPSDEITEVWNEVKGVLALLLLLALLANILVYVGIGQGLAPIETILKGLDGIEQGEYQLRLPRFKFPELSRISEKFNNMAEVLQKSRDENKLLTQESLVIQEQERRRLAHELHDEFGQSITAIKAVAVSIQQTDTSEKGLLASRAETIVNFSDRMYEVARKMMRQLRPAILDEFGLITALQDMIDDWNSRHEDVFCHFEFEGKFSDLDEDVSITLYRIIQESLTNVIKHADASDVTIRISETVNEKDDRDNNGIQLLIKDNGRGFTENTPWGLGLLGIRERTERLKGSFNVQSAPNKGVEISILL